MHAAGRSFYLVAAFCSIAAAVSAFTFEPMSVSFDASGPGAVRTFRVKNDGKERIPVRVRMLTRETAEDGAELNVPVPEGLFVVFPSRFVLEPGVSRALKVQWKGPAEIGTERSFRIVAEQVPVEFQERQGSGISLLFKYVGAVYVCGAGTAPASIEVVSARGAGREGRGRGVELRVRNAGGTHSILLDCSVSLSAGAGAPVALPRESLAELEGSNILAGSERVFFLPYGRAEPGASYEARIDFTADR